MIKPVIVPLQYFDKLVFKGKKIDIKDTLLLSGTPRSGTTWLMEIFQTLPGYISLFEPVNPIFFPESYEVGFKPRKHLLAEQNWPDGQDFLKKTFTGKTYTRVPLYELNPEMILNRLFGNKLIVKAIGLNRVLPWIAKNFELRGIFFIIRHPCAVISSQLKTGYCGYHLNSSPYSDIFPTVDNVLEEASEIPGIDEDLIRRLKKIKTQEEILAAIWCLDNYVPLNYKKPHPWIFVVYEKIITQGANEIKQLFNKIGEENIPKSAIKKLNIPSMLAPRDELKVVKDSDKQLSKWKKYLTKKQIDRILSIVSDFGLDFYTEEIEPDYENKYLK
jgi:hypothetical protein